MVEAEGPSDDELFDAGDRPQKYRADRPVEYPSDDELFDALLAQNPWWTGGGVPSRMRREFKRADYAEMLRRLDDKDYEHHVHALVGARRVGKTTVLYQLVDELVSRGDPRRVMFATLDDEALFPVAGNLRRLLSLYSRRVLLEQPMRPPSQRTYIILDEIQAARRWQITLKNVVDRLGPTTIVVSGSSSANMVGTSRPLLGRIRHQTMMPMSFSEYASFKGRPYVPALGKVGAGMRSALAASVRDGDAGAFYERAKESLSELALTKGGILTDLSEYMVYGGCPGIAAAAGHDDKAEQLKTHLRISMYQDVVKVGGVRSPHVLEPLFAVLARRSPRIINKDRIAKNLGINKITLDAYLGYLKAAYLVSYSDPYAPIRSRAERKVYIVDTGMRNTATSRTYIDSLSDSTETGLLAESIAGDHTRRLWTALDPSALPEMPYYWRSSRGDKVDLVIDLQHKPVPIEVKYRRQVESSDLKGLSRFVDKFGARVALALTQDHTRLDGRIVCIPLWLYLSMC